MRFPLCDFLKSAEVSRLMVSLVGAEANEGLLEEELVAGAGVGVGFGSGSVVGPGFGVDPRVVTVFTDMVTEASPVLALPAASVKAPAVTETTPSAVLLCVGVKVAV